MKNQVDLKVLSLIAAILLSAKFQSVAADTDGNDFRQLVQRCLPGTKVLPDAPSKPLALTSASGDSLDLMIALRENPEPRKGAGYWSTPTMRYLARQQMTVTNTNQAQDVIHLLEAITRGAGIARENTYRARAVDGGWVVEVSHDLAKNRGDSEAPPPYELLAGASHRVTQIRERCYPFPGSPSVYEQTVRTVYEREIKLNGAVNYEVAVRQELAKEWEKEKAQKMIK